MEADDAKWQTDSKFFKIPKKCDAASDITMSRGS
jgi:hypothetical protein